MSTFFVSSLHTISKQTFTKGLLVYTVNTFYETRQNLKKIFQLQEKNKKPDRTLDSIKNEIRKYFKRERSKKLPEDAIFWEFDCRFGKDEASAEAILANNIVKALDKSREEEWQSCYIEIISKPSDKKRAEKNKVDTEEA